MRETIYEILCFFFLGAGFVVEGNPFFNLGCFLISAVFAYLVILIEDSKERRTAEE